MSQELKDRVQKRLAKIQSDKDSGLYAKFYTEDANALLALIAELEETTPQQIPLPNVGT